MAHVGDSEGIVIVPVGGVVVARRIVVVDHPTVATERDDDQQPEQASHSTPSSDISVSRRDSMYSSRSAWAGATEARPHS